MDTNTKSWISLFKLKVLNNILVSDISTHDQVTVINILRKCERELIEPIEVDEIKNNSTN
jgi:hypothetical protein